jgi:hypothetical protein
MTTKSVVKGSCELMWCGSGTTKSILYPVAFKNGNKIEISDTQRYKMCGNGVVSNVVRELTSRIINNSSNTGEKI